MKNKKIKNMTQKELETIYNLLTKEFETLEEALEFINEQRKQGKKQ